jgi:hypothetical protein
MVENITRTVPSQYLLESDLYLLLLLADITPV